jgi:hypothetical protein
LTSELQSSANRVTSASRRAGHRRRRAEAQRIAAALQLLVEAIGKVAFRNV